jgi:hypothetical protein
MGTMKTDLLAPIDNDLLNDVLLEIDLRIGYCDSGKERGGNALWVCLFLGREVFG